ncbi:hypothetical protein [Chryseolinea soli]|uniref:Uncharacterized protein n=1 Tax=Chryseolinea soli TaxID=2321403 RepID=A0A385SSZ7_9BACT|nr:hypothetical protein [Chryseolinea soli]AYB34339.1 hypothetical protein D4L85_28845 [Chryseolinea soli]
MKRLFTYLALFFSSASLVAQSNSCLKKTKALEIAYQSKSVKLLTDFLEDWHKASIQQLKAPQKKDSLTEIIYSIHRGLFDPFDYTKFGWVEWGNRTWFTGSRFILIQDMIPYATRCDIDIDSLSNHLDYVYTDTVFNFQPDIKFEGVKTLLMLDQYKCVAKNFIQVNTFEKEIEYYEKKNFLDTLLKTTMDRDWSAILTQPTVIGIVLCNNRLAIVDYQIASTGMRSLMKLENGQWTIKESIELWIAD